MSRSVVVIGVGNESRGDDAVGLEIVRRLASLDRQKSIEVRVHEGEGLGLFDLWDGADAVVLVDCMHSGAAPGTLRRIDATSRAVPLPLRGTSSHGVGVAEAIELARALETLPPTVVVFGVEGASYEIGSSLSESVASAIDLATGAVRSAALELLAGSLRVSPHWDGSYPAMAAGEGPRSMVADPKRRPAMYENVVVGINGLSGDRDAIILANALAPGHARPALVNVRVMTIVGTKGTTGAFEATEAEFSRELLQRQRRAYAGEADVVSVGAMSVGAGLHQVALDHDADLIVVGGCHRGLVGRMLAGDDTQSALHHAPCAVAIAPIGYAERSAPIGRIGVAYDGSEQSEVALAHSALLASDLGAKLRAREVVELHVYGAAGWAPAAVMIEDPDALAAAAREQIGPIPGAEIDVVMGPVLTELAELSEEVDLMVCGSRQQAAAKRVLLGSTSDYLVRHSHCPLLVTPASDAKHVAAWQALRDAAAV